MKRTQRRGSLGTGHEDSMSKERKEVPLSGWRSRLDSNQHALSGYSRFSKPLPYQLGLLLHMCACRLDCHIVYLRVKVSFASNRVYPVAPQFSATIVILREVMRYAHIRRELPVNREIPPFGRILHAVASPTSICNF